MSLATTPGSITITTIAMITFPRALEPSKGPKNKVFDVNLNIRDGCEDTTLGLLWYFVPDNLMDSIENIKNFTQVFLVATIAAMPSTGPTDKSIATQDIESWSEYAFLGDIIQVTSFITSLFHKTNMYKLVFIDNINNDVEPYINLCGTVTDSNRNESSFNMRPSQYCNLLHNSYQFPAHLLITNSKRWSNKKPLPAIGSRVSVGGFLHGIHRNTDKFIDSFDIDIANIAYITNCAEPQSGPSQASRGTRSRARFDYKAHHASTSKQNTQPSHETHHPSLKRKVIETEEGNVGNEKEEETQSDSEEVPTKQPHTENM